MNQEDLLGTLMTFTTTIIESLEKAGARFDAEDAAAYLHAWCVVGHLLGIRHDLLPIELDDARGLSAAIRARQQTPSAEGQEMAASLVSFARRATPWPLKGLPPTTIRFNITDRVADMIDVPRADWTRHLFGLLRRATSAVSAGPLRRRLIALVLRFMNRRIIRLCLDIGRGDQRPDFAIPDHLADGWRVRR